MIILAYGIPQPTTGDRGSVFFPALEQVIQRLASHNHDGNNTALIAAAFVQIGSVVAPAVSWSLVSPGKYEQTVTLPANYLYDNCEFQVRLDSTKEIVYPKIERVASNQVKLTASTDAFDYRVYVK